MPGSVRNGAVLATMLVSGVFIQARAAEPVVVAAIGDYGSSGGFNETQVANLLKGWNPYLIVTLGDNSYGSDIDLSVGSAYHEFIYPYLGGYGSGASSNRFFPSLGNHEYLNANAQPYFAYFTLPGNERYYTFRHGPIDFFVINSNPEEPDGTTNSSAQADWLRSELAASTNAWKIVYFHHPPYSSGYWHGSDAGMRWPFAEWGASAVLAAHEHSYERIHTNNIPYFVNGLGGASIYPFATVIAGSQVRYNGTNGAMRIEATDTNLVLSFLAVQGGLVDSLTLRSAYGLPGFAIQPQSQTGLLSGTLTFDSFATAAGSLLAYQWFFGSTLLTGETNSSLTVTNLTFGHEGTYSVTASNELGAAHHPTTLSVARHPLISQQPTNQTATNGDTVTFHVQANAYGPLRYQWSYNMTEIDGATNSAYSITNVHDSHEGAYSVTLTDDLGSVMSSNATLIVRVRPYFVVPPLTQSVVAGQTAVFSYAIDGDWPIYMAMSVPTRPLARGIITDSNLTFLTIINAQPANAGTHVMQITNSVGRVLLIFGLNVLSDSDGDGAPDSWETANGFDNTDPSDGPLDRDGDGVSNRDEFRAGTDPNSASSYLRVNLSEVSSNEVRLDFTAMTNKTYALQYHRDSLTSATWSNLTEFPATTNTRPIQVTNALAPGTRFYRVVTPRLP